MLTQRLVFIDGKSSGGPTGQLNSRVEYRSPNSAGIRLSNLRYPQSFQRLQCLRRIATYQMALSSRQGS